MGDPFQLSINHHYIKIALSQELAEWRKIELLGLYGLRRELMDSCCFESEAHIRDIFGCWNRVFEKTSLSKNGDDSPIISYVCNYIG